MSENEARIARWTRVAGFRRLLVEVAITAWAVLAVTRAVREVVELVMLLPW